MQFNFLFSTKNTPTATSALRTVHQIRDAPSYPPPLPPVGNNFYVFFRHLGHFPIAHNSSKHR